MNPLRIRLPAPVDKIWNGAYAFSEVYRHFPVKEKAVKVGTETGKNPP